jgi:hypothetical protein
MTVLPAIMVLTKVVMPPPSTIDIASPDKAVLSEKVECASSVIVAAAKMPIAPPFAAAMLPEIVEFTIKPTLAVATATAIAPPLTRVALNETHTSPGVTI